MRIADRKGAKDAKETEGRPGTVFCELPSRFTTLFPNFNIDAGYQLQLINTVLSGLANQANNIILVQLFINL